MLRSLASDALGLSDIGKIIPPEDYNKTEIDDYVIHEDNEQIYFLIQAKSDEYCFTNYAFLHLDGQSAVSKKRLMKRYDYRHFPISNVLIETASRLDLDAELKFNLGGTPFSIDIDRNQINAIRDMYKALLAITKRINEIQEEIELTQKTFNGVLDLFEIKEMEMQAILGLPDIINQSIEQISQAQFKRLKAIREKYDMRSIFEHYIKN